MLKNYVMRKMGIPVKDMILIYMGEEIKNCKLDRVIQKVAQRQDPHSDECTIHLLDIKDTPLEVRKKEEPPEALEAAK